MLTALAPIVWRNERRRVVDLSPAKYNPRKTTDLQTQQLAESLDRFSLADPIIINLNNTVIGGHFRLRILQAKGVQEVDVRVPDRLLSEEEERELNLRLNKNRGDWDFELLGQFDKDMLSGAGFSSDELQKAFDVDVQEDGFDADAAAAQITQPVTVRGDIYQLGRHRLMCGDSTSHDDVARLMAGELADMVFTDPPYNVDYKYAKYEAIHRGRKKKFLDGGKIFNDKKTPDEFEKFLSDVFLNIYAFSTASMSLYVCHATKTQAQFFNAFHDSGFHFSQTIIWLKERFILAMGQDYHRVYEPIIFGWKEGEDHYRNKMMSKEVEVWNLDRLSFEEQLDVWFLNRDKSADYIHPTQKPVRLPERAIKKNCPMGGLLYEPFSGSGSTMMACEQLGRRCFAMELDPRYCDVEVARWEKYTGQKAVRCQ